MKNRQVIMVQGTTSDAGKSILVTALCRIFARHGLKVAPFKAQNMALNSAVTDCGGEIGRAQAVQAEACYLKPSVLMNPILLKPNSDIGAQVIVNGQAIGNMKADSYHEQKPHLLDQVVSSFNRLKADRDVIVIEGAGSPAEINLRDRDIVNMGLAEAIDCPVIIVADIDRGGVFAHLVGTYDLLSDIEKSRVKGFVINRFRGDINLLQPGIDWLENRLNVPVLAVIPYINHLHIEAEDALDQQQIETGDKKLHIKIIGYPRTSNHTDFDVLRVHPHIDCQFIRSPHDIQPADLIILPGSKSVRDDLSWLIHQGLADAIKKHLRYGGKVFGICGGYQMLGSVIHDPLGIESEPGSSQGLGYLDMSTTLTAKKTLQNIEGVSIETGSVVKGYEIHAGISEGQSLNQPLFKIKSIDQPDRYLYDGAKSDDDQVRGSYIHGLFDETAMLQDILAWAGLSDVEGFDYALFREKEIDRLADVVESSWPYDQLRHLVAL